MCFCTCSQGICSRPLWIDLSVPPCGIWTVPGFSERTISVISALEVTKCAVTPALAIALSTTILIPFLSKHALLVNSVFCYCISNNVPCAQSQLSWRHKLHFTTKTDDVRRVILCLDICGGGHLTFHCLQNMSRH